MCNFYQDKEFISYLVDNLFPRENVLKWLRKFQELFKKEMIFISKK